ncbi:BTB/POZ domain protein [Rhizoctonia solani AG-3 Rhs1AP]|uniref:BTB/POZ domain protein n=1 Tax=Rhizoctonia solani AG-3 Rhs1AP TaxID=1086054 RepID=X8IWP9_9AGAM|nr:BTB/POZ domain protein [Rhizoctonia solani AG-3 Rhs1AP]
MAKGDPVKLTSRAGRWVFIDEAPDSKSDDKTSGDSESPEPHPDFFFDNTLVAIQIGKTLFNVHKYQLAKSEVFSDMFKIPKPEGGEPEEGSSPEHPIKLEGVSALDFAALLRVLYASHFSSNQPVPEASLVIPAFRLANMFNFSELRAFLLPLAEQNLNDVDKIVFAREFNIKEWLTPAHVRLCQWEEPLSGEEARKLGIESVLIVSRMREQHQDRASAFTINLYYCGSCVGMEYSTNVFYNCARCGTQHSSGMRYTGTNTSPHLSTASINNIEVEAGIRKWVEDGCTIKD